MQRAECALYRAHTDREVIDRRLDAFLYQYKKIYKLRKPAMTALDAAVSQGSQPTAPRNGIGLVIKTPVGRYRKLIDKNGLTPAGTYYYAKSGLPPPRSFDFQP